MNILKNLMHPKKIMNDSMWFKQDNVEIDITADNLFVISHLGQLSQVEALIEYENLIDNFLVIVYASTNKKMPELIKKKYNRQLFKESYLLLLPDAPNDMRSKKLLFIRRNYIQVFKAVQPKSLYVLSFEGHYNLLLSYAKQNNCKLCLIEEGTATYKKELLSESRKGLRVKFKSFGLNIIYFFVKSFLFFKQIRSIKSEVKRYKNFDKLYVSFPDLVKNKFDAKETENFFLHAGEIKNRNKIEIFILKYNMTANDFIYVNQRYPIKNQEFAKAIMIILEEISKEFKSKIFIKMHPKDTPSLKAEFIKQIQIRNIQKEIVFIEESDFLIEPTVAVLQPRAVLGLTSTALVYVPLVSKKTNVYSIALKFLNQISVKSYNQNGIGIIKEHLDILRDFNHVHILEKNESLLYFEEKNNKNNLVTEELDVENIIKIVKLSLVKKQYKKVYFYLEKMYPNGIESMPLDIKEFYKKAQDIEKKILIKRDSEFIENIKIQENFSNYKVIEEMMSSLEYKDLFKMPIEVLNIYIKSLHIQNKKEKLYLFLKQISMNYLLDNLDFIEKDELSIMAIREFLRFGKFSDATKMYHQILSAENQINKKVLMKITILFLEAQNKNSQILSFLKDFNTFIDDQELVVIYIKSLYILKEKDKLKEFIQMSSEKFQLLGEIYLKILNMKLIDAIFNLEEILSLFTDDEQIAFGIRSLLIDLYLQNLNLDKAREHLVLYEKYLKGDIRSILQIIKLNSLLNNWNKVELLLDDIYQENLLNMSMEIIELYLLALINLEKKYKLLHVVEFLLINNCFTVKILSQYIDALIQVDDIVKAKEIIFKYVDGEYQDFFNKKLHK